VQPKRLAQYLITQIHHLLILLCPMIYHPKRHAVDVFSVPSAD
jgi:hypothetical protein